MVRRHTFMLLLVVTVLTLGPSRLAQSTCVVSPSQPVVPQTDTVWIEDEWTNPDSGGETPGGPPTTYSWPVDSSQHVSGTASFPGGYENLMGVLDLHAIFPQPKPLSTPSNIVAYILISNCDPAPTGFGVEIQLDEASLRYYWGDQTLWQEVDGGEVDGGFLRGDATDASGGRTTDDAPRPPVRLGDVPPAGQWIRLEMPVGVSPGVQPSAWSVRLLTGKSGQGWPRVWWDHIGVAAAANPPTINSIAPSVGASAGGTSVDVTGSGFVPGQTTVAFGTRPATATTVTSSTELTAIAPAGTGIVDVTVTTSGGTATRTGAFTYVAPPAIGRPITPDRGRVAGGQTIHISGSNFVSGETTVTFGATAASVTVLSSTTLHAISPVHAAGLVDVAVTTVGGSASAPAAFRYLDPPVIHGFSPAEGLAGVVVTITGDSFDPEPGANTVSIGGVTTPVVSGATTQLVVRVPATARTGAIVVQTAGGTATSATNFVVPMFTELWIEPPSVTLNLGESRQLRAKARSTDGEIRDVTTAVSWNTGNAAIASITGAGQLQGLGRGTTAITARYADLTATASVQVTSVELPPPDPRTIASPIDPTRPTIFSESIAFLHAGPAGTQRDVATGAISTRRVAVARGRVTDSAGTPLSGVRVAVQRQPEVGYTISRADGGYDLVFNGGGAVTLTFTKDGFIPIQRTPATPWNEMLVLDDVRMLAYDANVTAIRLPDLTANAVARGSVTNDESGSRRATMIFQPGTTATMRFANGALQPLNELHVRATEQSIGKVGAMPAELPSESAYTYCVELSADEAVTAGASSIHFTKPVVVYVENFLGFPVGVPVPAGYYDRDVAQWIASDDGRVIKLLSVTAGLAAVDTDGDGVEDSGASLGMTEAERHTIGSLYPAGQSLWRVAVTHFTPWDFNWGWGPVDGAVPPDLGAPSGEASLSNESCQSGSLIECESLSVGQSIPLSGTPFTLEYRSRNMPGYRPKADIVVTLSGDSVPSPLKRIDVDIVVAGVKESRSFSTSPNQKQTFSWDGSDAYGRRLYTDRRMKVSVHYVYDAVFRQPAGERSFGAAGGLSLGVETRREIKLSQDFLVPLRGPRPDQGFGGWALSGLHAYDPIAAMLRLGSGADISLGARGVELKPVNSGGTGVATGPDGSIYTFGLARPASLRRITPDGFAITIAGAGGTTPADGVAAVGAYIGIADAGVLSTGEVVFLEAFTETIYRIDSAGILRKMASGQSLVKMTVAAGAVYFIDDKNLKRVDAQGNIVVVTPRTETTQVTGIAASSSLATPYVQMYEHPLNEPFSGNYKIYRGPSPSIGSEIIAYQGSSVPGWYTVDPGGRVIVSRQEYGIFYVDAAGSEQPLPAMTPFGVAGAVAFLPDGQLVYSDSHNPRVCPNVNNRVSCVVAGGSAVAAGDPAGGFHATLPDGMLGLRFDSKGKHAETRDPRFGIRLSKFEYDEGTGLVSSIEDANGLTTMIERGTGNAATAIVAPNGDRTEFILGADGLISEIRGSGGVTHEFTYSSDGLMRTHRDPRGKTSTYEYDSSGRLRSARDPADSSKTLVATKSGTAETVTVTSAEGRIWRYVTNRPGEGSLDRTLTNPVGLSSRSISSPRSIISIAPDGTRTDITLAPDTIWKTMAPIPLTTAVRYPSGRTLTVTNARTYSGGSPSNPYGATWITETSTMNGRTVTTTTHPETRNIRIASPLNRAVEQFLDVQGRVQEVRWPGKAPITIQYDTRGRVSTISQGQRVYTLTWGAHDRLASASNPNGQSRTFTYDDAGRLTSQTINGTLTTSFTYDAAGNLLTLTPPGRPAHVFRYNDVGLADEYDAPDDGATQYIYNRDRQLTGITEPGGRSIALSYDRGRLQRVSGSDRSLTFSYHDGGQLRSISDSRGPAVEYGFDGPIHTQMTWAGEVSGAISWGYDSSLRIASEAVNGAAITYAYDNDSLITAAGQQTFSRDAGSGRLTGSTLGTVSDVYTHNAFGEVSHYTTARAGSTVFTLAYGRDIGGRIVSKTENRFGFPAAFAYTYDPAGRLETVKRDGALVATYAYDGNGNRIAVTTPSATTTAAYDAADRLLSYGSTTYAYSPAGNLATRTDSTGTTTYDYDAFGNLRRVARPNLPLIEYVIDAADRRVGKKVDGAISRRWLYRDDLKIVAELDASGAVVSRFVYASRTNVPDYMVRAGATYRFLVDHLGSVRYVLDASNGAIMQSVDYDEFGRVVFDSNPAFQPFGFAGGHYDPDTGLVRFGARDYDPETGRWTGKDPIGFAGGDTNLYGYVINDPVNRFDPTGLLFQGSVNAGEAYGQDAMNYYADIITDPESAWYAVIGAYIGGGFSALWTPCTSDKTFTTLTIAYSANGYVGRSFYQYYPANNPAYSSRYLTRSSGWKPPYPPGTEAAERLSLPPWNPGTAVRAYPNRWNQWVGGPRWGGVAPNYGHTGGGTEYLIGAWPK